MISVSAALAAMVFSGAAHQDFEASLIKVGQTVPNASVTIPGGNSVKLHSLLRGKKAAVINFWFYH